MRVPDDLHPDDLCTRLGLAGALRSHRETGGVTVAQVAAALHVDQSSVRRLEQRTTWEARTVMRYARALGRRIEWVLTGLTVPDDGDVLAAVYAVADTSLPERHDKTHWRQTCNDLRRIRRAGHTAAATAARLGVTEGAVYFWETNPDGSTVISGQRHARALGGALQWRLHPAARPVPAPRRAC